MCEGKIYYARNIIAPKQRGTTMCEGKIYKVKNSIAPEQRGTTMCEGKIYSAMKSSGSGTLTGTSRIMHLQAVEQIYRSENRYTGLRTDIQV